jgi:hypothetical protein
MNLMSLLYQITSTYVFRQVTQLWLLRDPKRTNWESYKDDLKVNLETMLQNICYVYNADLDFDQLQQSIISSYHQNCPVRATRSLKKVHWWNKELSGLRVKIRRPFDIANRKENRTPIRRPSSVITKLGKPKGHHGGGTAKKSLMYHAVLDS